jgi:type I restriction enzyme S subunit
MGETILADQCDGNGYPIYSADTGPEPWNHSTHIARLHRLGTIVVGARGSIGFPRLPALAPFGATQTTITVTPSSSLEPEYLKFVLESLDWKLLTQGMGIPMLTVSQLASVAVRIPALREQRRIAEFLDRETALIDALIAKQQQLISTLAERLSALRTDVWTATSTQLGQHQGELRKVRLKHLLGSIDQGVSPEASAELADETSWGVLKSGCVNRGVFNPLEHKRLDADFSVDPRHAVRVGDLIVNRASGSPELVGSAAVVRALGFNLILSDKTFRLRLNSKATVDYLVQFMQSRLYRDQVIGAISGAGGLANNLPVSALKNFSVPLAPPSTQARIVDVLSEAEDDHRAAVSANERIVELLRERRQALISAAVTGKINVGGAPT